MHFLLSPFGSAGDVFPMLGLALQLQQLEQRVTVLVNGYFEETTRSLGLAYEPFGTADEFLELVNNPDLWHPRRAVTMLMKQGVARNMRQHYQFCQDHLRSDPSTVVVTNMLGMGARVAQDKLGLKVVTLHLQPSVMWSDHEPPELPVLFGPAWMKKLLYRAGLACVIHPAIRPALNEFRAELKLPPVRDVFSWWHSPYLVASLFPDWYANVQPDWPKPHVQTNFPLWDIPSGPSMPDDVDKFLNAGEPPIVFTLGSANVFGSEFYAAAADACRLLNRRGLLMTRFAEQIPQSLPAGVKHAAFAPFSELLPRSAALVHHGGVGSMSQAMAAGIPQVIVPLAHDQFDNAKRVRRLGLGEELPKSRLNAQTLERAVSSVITSNHILANSQGTQQRLANRNGLSELARRLVQFATEHDAAVSSSATTV